MPFVDATSYYNSHKRSFEQRARPFEAILPLMNKSPVFNGASFPFTPKRGYLRVRFPYDQPVAPRTAFQFVVPLEAAMRIAYESTWGFQANIGENWLEYVARKLIEVILHLAQTFADAITAGIAVPIIEAGKAIYELLAEDIFNAQLDGALNDQIRRLTLNSLPGSRGVLFDDELIERIVGSTNLEK